MQKLVKCVEKSEKCKPDFVGFEVKNPTTFVILASASA
jgi:hypothetical protein